MPFRLRFKKDQIRALARRYKHDDDRVIMADVVPRAKRAGCLAKPDLLAIGKWKSPRIVWSLDGNHETLVREVTTIALSARREEIRIGALLILRGVGWPVASVILHLCHRDRYPILDFRALWSVGSTVPQVYTFPFWWEYTEFCRQVARDAGVNMRLLDRALWQYSKENPPVSGSGAVRRHDFLDRGQKG
jgi:hypothetical protein